MTEIEYCPVCGSEDIQKQPIKPRYEFGTDEVDIPQESVDYYCEDCESNGDIDIIVKEVE